MQLTKHFRKKNLRVLLVIKLISKVVLILLASQADLFGQQTVASPDGRLVITLKNNDSLALSVAFSGSEIQTICPWMTMNGTSLTSDNQITEETITSIKSEIIPVVSERRSLIPDHYNQLEVTLSKKLNLIVRVYDDGWGYRFMTHVDGIQIIDNEGYNLYTPEIDSIWFPEETSFLSHSERLYPHLKIDEIPEGHFCSLPALLHGKGCYIAVSEAWLEAFPGLYLKSVGKKHLSTTHPPYPIEETQINDRTVAVTKSAPYIAKTNGSRMYPWRVFGVTSNPGDLVGSDLVYRFGPPQQITETDWIEPGLVSWDWWNDNNISGVPFKAGINTNTYKYYIDFASDYGLKYIILDEGWSNPSNLFDINPNMNIAELFDYAKQKKVRIILWVLFNTLDKQLDAALEQFEKWGAAGIKVDFMQRDDQKMVEYYWKIAGKAAEKKFLVDFHGSYKPDGLRRAFPNVLTREGVKGLENNKWGKEITPSHDLILPFTRMFAGPMDYTPGAMINATQQEFHAVWSKPMSQGTRCHQLALYVVFESPLQMLADNPTHYRRAPEAMQLLKDIPVVWDETQVVEAEPGKKLVILRRKEDVWYVGALTDWSPREITIQIPQCEGKWIAEIWKDGINASKNASDYIYITDTLPSASDFRIKMAPGGGFVMKLTQKK